MKKLINSIMAAFQQVSYLAKGPGAIKLIALKLLLKSSSLDLKRSSTEFFRFYSQD